MNALGEFREFFKQHIQLDVDELFLGAHCDVFVMVLSRDRLGEGQAYSRHGRDKEGACCFHFKNPRANLNPMSPVRNGSESFPTNVRLCRKSQAWLCFSRDGVA